MKIAFVVLGTRGDVQPMVALATGLMKKGHQVVICAPEENERLARDYDCPFIPFGPGIKETVRNNPEQQKGGVAVKVSPAKGKQFILDQVHLLPDLIRGVDLVLGAGLVIGVRTAADRLKVPYRLVAFYPIILGTTKEDPAKSRMMFGFGRKVLNLMMKGYLNKARVQYGIQPVKDIWEHWMGEKVIVACDKVLNEAREGSTFAFTQTGFMLLPSKTALPEKVSDFINAGPPPIYLGFGSNPIVGTERFTSLFEKVREATQQRLIISKGWAEFPERNSEGILYVDEMPFELLFPRVAAAVYHGGTGTMAAIARAAIPQAAFPFMGDQFDNRKQIVKLGLGPQTCDFKKMTAEVLIHTIQDLVTNENYKKAAQEVAQKMMGYDGVELTIEQLVSIFE